MPDLNHFEYVYKVKDLAELSGKKYLKIRSQINKFKKNYQYTVEQITPGNREEIFEFLIKWCKSKGCEKDLSLAQEIEAIFYAMEHFNELDIHGLLIRVDSKVGAIALFERLNANTALVHFEKGLSDYKGIYKAINKYTAEFLLDKVEFINRESDLGIPGLREAKMRYYPHHMVAVYSIKR